MSNLKCNFSDFDKIILLKIALLALQDVRDGKLKLDSTLQDVEKWTSSTLQDIDNWLGEI